MTWIERIKSKTNEARLRRKSPIAMCEVDSFQEAAGIRLPFEYVEFITQVGNGGIEPICLIQSLNEWCNCHWIDDPRPEISLQTRSIVTPEAASHGENWIDAAGVKDWEERFERNNWDPMFGTIAIAEVGCGLYFSMVVNGEQCGRVFIYGDHISSPPQLAQETTFGHWLENAMDCYLSGKCVDFLDRTRLHRQNVKRRNSGNRNEH